MNLSGCSLSGWGTSCLLNETSAVFTLTLEQKDSILFNSKEFAWVTKANLIGVSQCAIEMFRCDEGREEKEVQQ